MKSIATASQARTALRQFVKPDRAPILMRFFKTGKGEYAEGDKFIGVMVPETRSVAARAKGLSLKEAEKLLISKIHEERLLALFILAKQFAEGSPKKREKIFKVFLKNKRHVDNWDLVDSSAPYISGPVFFEQAQSSPAGRVKAQKTLLKMAKSKNLWERRIAIMSTFYFIKQNEFAETLMVSEILIRDEHDLIHKAVGWMLREVGNRDQKAEEAFLKKHYKIMPRTMLRYAIEKFSPKLRAHYMGR
ncbi:MAG TPA: DNA alkylation repair protein [Bdellovibrionales bacterium]|nr:DNA alkylation repair protein [Bdellovibrionales bacterium]